MRLFSALQSMRLCADAEIVSHKKKKGRNRSGMQSSLLVPQSLHRIEARSAACGVQTGQQADHNRKRNGAEHQPPRDEPDLFRRKMLALQIHVCTQVNDSSDGPTQRDSNDAA